MQPMKNKALSIHGASKGVPLSINQAPSLSAATSVTQIACLCLHAFLKAASPLSPERPYAHPPPCHRRGVMLSSLFSEPCVLTHGRNWETIRPNIDLTQFAILSLLVLAPHPYNPILQKLPTRSTPRIS